MSLLTGDKSKGCDIIVDFEKAEPQTDEEKKIHKQVGKVLKKGPGLLDDLVNYQSCGEFIKEAISKPSDKTENDAWNAVLPAVTKLKEFFDFSLELESCFPKLLLALCKINPAESIASQQALAKQLADVIDFVLKFDDAKMVNSSIQNDFSYYRRTLNRMKIKKTDQDLVVKDELANRMSLFFAYPTPMMNALTETTVKFLQQDNSVPKANVTNCLVTMANVCLNMVETKKFSNSATNLFCLRAMTGAIILYDHIHELGAFHKKSPINIRGCITILKDKTILASEGSSKGNSPLTGLLNALRFTTKHVNDADTPANIRQLLA